MRLSLFCSTWFKQRSMTKACANQLELLISSFVSNRNCAPIVPMVKPCAYVRAHYADVWPVDIVVNATMLGCDQRRYGALWHMVWALHALILLA